MKLLKAIILVSFANCFGQNISISNVTVVEGEIAYFVVTLSEPSTQETQIDLITSIGYNFNDFQLLNNSIYIPAGETTGTFAVATTEDNFGEATEYGELCPYVSSQTSYTCGTLTILDNDPNIVGEVIAQNDNLTFPVGIVVPFYNVLSNDTINGIPATVDSVILTPISLPVGFLLTSRGNINLQGTELPGTYLIEYQLCAVSDPTNCTIGTVSITLYDPLAVTNFAFENLRLFPNPAKNYLSISNTSMVQDIEITSLLGQQMMHKGINEFQAEIDISSLKKGIYFAQITSGTQQKTVKIIKE